MIISPPFLPIRNAGQSEESWLTEAMFPVAARLPDTHAAEGSYPLSHNLCWHNGVHIQAPTDDGGNLPVRAIADGIVRFAHQPATANLRVDDPQNYNPFQRDGAESTPAWTDNGCIIIEHVTAIGAAGAAETLVTFYSLYMHLSELGHRTQPGQNTGPLWAVGDRIWRKDVVGQPGRIYGMGGQIHFEICLNKGDLQALIGRAPAWLEPAAVPTADGRVDSIFGSLYFYLPAATPTDTGAAPSQHIRGGATPLGTTLGQPMWVQMTYQLGACIFQSFDQRGFSMGAPTEDANAEHDLYQSATDRHNTLAATDRATSSPSGWYELLRFGRNIGRGVAATDKDPLPANAAHWRRIRAAGGAAVWVDLNTPGSFKFSDADFLPVMGWNCIDDDTSPNDQRCDSEHLKSLIRDPDSSNSDRAETDELTRRLGDAGVRAKLQRTLCKFPSEWDKGTTTTRYGFVEELPSFKEAPGAWRRFEAHLKGISFDALPAAYLLADWHVHPRELVGLMRRCAWLGLDEMAQVVIRKTRGTPRIPITWAQARARIGAHHGPLNRTFRKYGFSDRRRQAHFFGQCVQETDYLQAMTEYIGMRADYAPYIGRGFTQLTWPKNYVSYGTFRGFSPPTTFTAAHFAQWYPRFRDNWYDGRPTAAQLTQHGRQPYILDGKTVPSWDVEQIADDDVMAVDSGGFYWIWKALIDSGTRRPTGDRSIIRLADTGFSLAQIDEVTYNINGGWNGRDIRRLTAPYAWSALNDEPVAADHERQLP